jgi:hypothetical protein
MPMSKRARAAYEAERERINALPEAPVNPARLQGPEVGERVHHVSTRYPQYDADVTVTERSYIWSPEKVVKMPDGSEHRGYRRYDLKVIRFDNGKTLLADDKNLAPLAEWTEGEVREAFGK